MIPDILVEHGRSTSLTADELRWFADQGVPVGAMSWSATGVTSLVKRDLVVIERRCGRFDFARHLRDPSPAREAYTVPLHNAAGDLADILAAERDGPIALWRGAVAMAGEDVVFGPRVTDEAVDVLPTFLDWLRAGRRGVLILHPHRAAPLLHLAAPIRAQSSRHALELRGALTIPAPRIVVRQARAGAAA